MKRLSLLLLFLSFVNCHTKTTAQIVPVKQPYAITILPMNDSAVTDAIKKVVMEDSVSDDRYKRNLFIERGTKKIIVTTYYSLSGSREYTASAEMKNDTIIIVINTAPLGYDNSEKDKYYKLEAVIDNPKNIAYPVIADQAFTFLEKGQWIKQFRDTYAIGDIDGDKIGDTAGVEYEKVIDANDSIDNDCGRGTCYMTAKFGKGIPDITESMCYWMSIEPLPDLNDDGRDEIVMATHYFHGCCHNVLVWSYDGKKWNLLCEANTFDDDEPDAPRVRKEKKGYYLHYRNWDEEMSDVVAKKKNIKVR